MKIMYEGIVNGLMGLTFLSCAVTIVWAFIMKEGYDKALRTGNVLKIIGCIIFILAQVVSGYLIYANEHPEHIKLSNMYEEYEEVARLESVVKKGYNSYTMVSIWTNSTNVPNPIILRTDDFPVAEHMFINSTIEWLWYVYEYEYTDWGRNSNLRHSTTEPRIIIDEWRLVDFNYTPKYSNDVIEAEPIINVDNSPVDPFWILLAIPVLIIIRKRYHK
jgi:hypothetical protein